MSLHVTQIEKHKFVCGLFWQSLSRPRELRKEAAELARKIDFDLMVLRVDQTSAQAGYAQERDGARRMLLSLGAAVSAAVAKEGAYFDGRQQRAHNWLGAFKLPDGMWAYFAVRDANFLPNGDFAGTREEVLDRLNGDYGLGGWNVVIGDAELEDYGFHNFNAKRIEDLLPRTKGGQVKTSAAWALRPVTSRRRWKAGLTIGALFAAGALGGTALLIQYRKNAEEAERDRAIEAARAKMFNAPPVAIKHPWADKPVPKAVVRACLDRFTHISAGGWQLDEYACTADRVNYAWSRNNSTVAFLLEQMPHAAVDLSGEKATYSETMAPGGREDEALLERKQLLDPVLSRMQLLGISIKVAKAQAPAPERTATGLGKNDAPVPDWQTFTFSFDTGGIPPSDAAAILSRPGIRVERVSYKNTRWSFEGVMYAK